MSGNEKVPTVSVGCWVKIQDQDTQEEEIYRIGQVTDVSQNKVAAETPFAQSLLGSKPGDEVVIHGPVGELKYTVVEVGRE